MLSTSTSFGTSQLLWQLVCRRLGGAYAAAVLGPLWQFLQPALYVAVLTLILSNWVTFEESGNTSNQPQSIRYGIFLCCGLLPWRHLSQSATTAASLFVNASQFLRRTRVDPLVYLWAELVSAALQFVVVFALFLVLAAMAGVPVTVHWLQLVPLVVLQFLLCVGIQLGSAPVGVFFRDLPHVYSVTFQLLFWATPIAYHARLLDRAPTWLLTCNPLWRLVGGYRTAVLGERWLTLHEWSIIGLIVGGALVLGAAIYRRLCDDVPDFV